MTAEEQTAKTSDEVKRPARVKGRKRRGLLHGLRASWFLMTMVCVLLLGAGLFLASGRPIDAPDWLRDQIEARAAANLGDVELSFGRMQLVVVEGFSPRVRLSDVTLESGDGVQIVGFSQMDTALALEPLLSGRVAPQEILISGIFATLKRSPDGALSLSGGIDFGAPAQQAPSLAALLKRLDAVFMEDALEDLDFVDIQALTLRYDDLASNQSWTIDGGRARLTRTGDDIAISADLALLSGADGIATMEANYATTLGASAASFGAAIENMDAAIIASQNPALAWLGALRAPISGALRSGVDNEGALSPLNATLTIGAGALQPTAATRPIPFEAARVYFGYDPAQQELRFDELSVESKWVTGSAEGVAWLNGLDSGRLDNLVSQLTITNLALNPYELYETAQTFPRASADLRLSLDPFRLEVGQMVVDLDGEDLVLSGDLRAQDDGWRLSTDAYVDALTPDRVVALWPEAQAPRTRKWIAENVKSGQMRDINFALRAQPGQRAETFVGFDFEAADVRFIKTFPHIKAGRGHASLSDNRLVISVDGGQVRAPSGGDISVAGSTFIIPDVRIKEATPGEVRLNTDSSIEAALSLIDLPPLRIMEKAGRETNLAEGRALIEGTLKLPLIRGLKTSQVDYALTGQLTEVRSARLLPNRQLASSALILEATPEAVLIGGPGTLDGVPFEAAWSQTLGEGDPGTVSGTLPINQATLDAFRISLPPGSVSGQAAGDITVSLPREGPPTFRLTSTLRGAGLRLSALGWSKGRDASGTLDVSGTLGEEPRIDSIALSAPGFSAAGRVSLRTSGALAEATFDRVQVGDWLDAPVQLIGRGAAPPEVRVNAGRIDLRRASFGEGGQGGGGGSANGPMRLALDRLQVSDTITLTDFRGQFAEGRGLDGRFTARVNGGAAVEGRVLPKDGRSAFQITSPDAGGVLKGAQVLKQARGGDMTLTLVPVPGAEGVMEGSLRVKDTRVRSAPVMADLLSAISIVGLVEQLSGNGISFTDVEAEFRLTPDQVILRRASAVGPSMGITMQGRYGLANQVMDMQGVISPVYFLNAIGQIFSRRGEGLIGFNYDIGGTAQDPRVQVNPLSALTPGFFREIFRAPPPDLPAGEAPRALVPTDQTQQRQAEREAREQRRREREAEER